MRGMELNLPIKKNDDICRIRGNMSFFLRGAMINRTEIKRPWQRKVTMPFGEGNRECRRNKDKRIKRKLHGKTKQKY